MEYPLYKNYHTLSKERVNTLLSTYTDNQQITKSRVRPTWTRERLYKYLNTYYLIGEKWNANLELNTITDHFTEDVRIKCTFSGWITPIDYFNSHKEEIAKLFNNNMNSNSLEEFREYMYHRTKFCNNFRISIILTFFNIFKPKRLLDVSAGWGDRLLSSIFYNVEEYVGCDPNLDLTSGYKSIMNTFSSEIGDRKFKIIQSGFETAILPHKNFDTVIMCPPFYDLETYSSHPGDSLVTNKTMEDWYNNFLIFSIRKAHRYMRRGGTLMLYMVFKDKSYLPRLIEDVSRFMIFKGTIYFYADPKKLRPMYIWVK